MILTCILRPALASSRPWATRKTADFAWRCGSYILVKTPSHPAARRVVLMPVPVGSGRLLTPLRASVLARTACQARWRVGTRGGSIQGTEPPGPIPIPVPIPDLPGIGDHPHPQFPSGVPRPARRSGGPAQPKQKYLKERDSEPHEEFFFKFRPSPIERANRCAVHPDLPSSGALLSAPHGHWQYLASGSQFAVRVTDPRTVTPAVLAGWTWPSARRKLGHGRPETRGRGMWLQ